MPNLKRGEVGFDLDGERYILRLATNEWCALEEEHGKTTDELIADFMGQLQAERLNMRFIRSFFHAALIGSKPEATADDAGAIMSDMGMVEAAQKLALAIQASMPEAPENANPPKAGKNQAGNGKNSKSSSARSASTLPNSGN